jgi:activator of HSP90 ATPase
MELMVTEVIEASQEAIYDAWLDGAGHAAMTGAEATGQAEVGAAFTAWDGYITGHNLALERPRRIVQAWRTSQFSDEEADSRVEVLLEAVRGGTRITLHHTELPAHGEIYRQGWIEHYFEPMKRWAAGCAPSG